MSIHPLRTSVFTTPDKNTEWRSTLGRFHQSVQRRWINRPRRVGPTQFSDSQLRAQDTPSLRTSGPAGRGFDDEGAGVVKVIPLPPRSFSPLQVGVGPNLRRVVQPTAITPLLNCNPGRDRKRFGTKLPPTYRCDCREIAFSGRQPFGGGQSRYQQAEVAARMTGGRRNPVRESHQRANTCTKHFRLGDHPRRCDASYDRRHPNPGVD
jgi:hypothetical protein